MADPNDTSTSSFTSGPLIATVIAVVVVVAAVIAIFVLNPRKTADLSVTQEEFFAPHTEFQNMAGSMHVHGQAPETEDDLYVIARIRLTDKLRLPLYLSDWTALVKLSDGSTVDATTVAASDLPRLEQIFPALTPLITQPLSFGDEVNPGATQEGSIILLFPNTTQSAWKSKQAAVLTLNLRDQAPETVPLH